jgi:hypothetical protein
LVCALSAGMGSVRLPDFAFGRNFMLRVLVSVPLFIIFAGSAAAQSTSAPDSASRSLLGCWQVSSPKIDSMPWRMAIDSQAAATGMSGVLWRVRLFGPAQRAWRQGVWGRLYPGLSDLYLSLGVAPGALEVHLQPHPDSLSGQVSIMNDTAPYRHRLSEPFVATRAPCAT